MRVNLQGDVMTNGYRVENPETSDVVETFDNATDAQIEEALSLIHI